MTTFSFNAYKDNVIVGFCFGVGVWEKLEIARRGGGQEYVAWAEHLVPFH
jgi:hypothetical protein